MFSLFFFFLYNLILLKIWLRVQGITQTMKKFPAMSEVFSSLGSQERMYLKPFPGMHQVEKLSSAEREHTGGRKLGIA